MRKLDKALDKLQQYVLGKKLFTAGSKILLCCSGGADSVALLYLFSKLRSQLQIILLAVHVDHQLRGAESAADAELVKDVCQELNIPVIVRKIKLEGVQDLENRARNKRFEVFRQLLELYRFDYIATAHHKNDLAETMLMNLFRGAGINGLAGIKPSSGKVIHPLLCFTKQELIDILTEEKAAWREDETNADNHFRRNRIRNKLLPLIESELNPGVIEKLCEQASIFLDADKLFKRNAVKQLKKATLDQTPERYSLSLEELDKLARVELYYVLKAVVSSICGTEQDFFMHGFESIVQLLQAKGSKYTLLSNKITVKKQYSELIFSLNAQPAQLSEPYTVEEDRSRALYGNFRFSFKTLRVLPRDRMEDGFNVYLDADKISYPISIRSRRAGDRFIPLGMTQHQKIKDLLIDRKVPKFERDSVPICEDGDKIIWIVGHKLDARVAIDQGTQRFLHITAEPVHEKAKRAANRNKKVGDIDESYEL